MNEEEFMNQDGSVSTEVDVTAETETEGEEALFNDMMNELNAQHEFLEHEVSKLEKEVDNNIKSLEDLLKMEKTVGRINHVELIINMIFIALMASLGFMYVATDNFLGLVNHWSIVALTVALAYSIKRK